MNESSGGKLLKIILHPATTIGFAIVGVALGIIVIRNSAKEDANAAYKYTYSDQLREISSKQSKLETEVQALQSSNDALIKALNGLAERVVVVENKLHIKEAGDPKKTTPPPSAGSKPRDASKDDARQ
jgi:hypothetical protein